ncbi:uncharacterized protein BCR38DRAFT_337231 [Pseudomassariella vexata]|uniref:UBC core domain-containing protein n=1 Tax=Pseudomassariella vexata TaxID=1141098 RepID=A0A1Y2E8B6_9PEZI|nr:uncharacterized protein BCR38DRAFT_337231 [Pseudomassariella vexata]ORY67564.1 hypothetical protein BCR38DRAFT_337231 [Pseudomassariella vexata]
MDSRADSNTITQHCHQRLMKDVDELVRKPYPNIAIHVADNDLKRICLLLSPVGWKKMHLTIENLGRYPLKPPKIRMDSDVDHPNVFGNYICASILNDSTAYTPAYTLKGIAIQLLSFFGSDSIEQQGGHFSYDLQEYRAWNPNHDHHVCQKCESEVSVTLRDRTDSLLVTSMSSISGRNGKKNIHGSSIDNLPDEILLLILNGIDDFEHLANFARAWSHISRLIANFDIVRQRELQCFTLKQSYHEVNLGVGVSFDRRNGLNSEFDLLSQQAYNDLGVRQSVHNIPFIYWLPIPISERHWRLVKDDADETLIRLKQHIKMDNPSNPQVLYSFMNDIVVKLNEVAVDWSDLHASRSTLRHASEKAIDSYFHLFHLLVCLATENPAIISQANQLINNFSEGKRSKGDCPNLGHLLVALLISDVEITEQLTKAIITEAITRNVVWLLDRKGGNSPELSYMETDAVSHYRLGKAFEGSHTSYRLLMFSELFRRMARNSNVPLTQVRDELFARHGAPPPGASKRMAAEVRRLHTVDNFHQFMLEMGIETFPSLASFTDVLRETMRASVAKGYSIWAISQEDAVFLRLEKEPGVGIHPNLAHTVNSSMPPSSLNFNNITFFPAAHRGRNKSGRGNGRSGRRGRDTYRGD